MSPPAFQRAERAAETVRSGSFVPSPDAALGDGDGAERHPTKEWRRRNAPDPIHDETRRTFPTPNRCRRLTAAVTLRNIGLTVA